MTFHVKLRLVQKHFLLGSIKLMDLLEFMMGLDIQYHSTLKNMIPLALELDAL